MIKLFEHQKVAVSQLKTGSILCGGVGSGKSLTSLYYYFTVECGGIIDEKEKSISPLKKPKDLYIITTAAKRDTLDWERDCISFGISKDRNLSISGVKVVVDSWNNINKYINIKDAFFIFDEQRVIGTGSWVKSFYKITKANNWILLTATPGDTWIDYVPVFIANGFFKNITEFKRKHVVYNSFSKFPKINYYIEETKLKRLRHEILVYMPHDKPAINHNIIIQVNHDKEKLNTFVKTRWNPYTNEPVKSLGEYFQIMRKIINSDQSRIETIKDLLNKHKKIIVFYNFDYELFKLRELNSLNDLSIAEHNGYKHEKIPSTNSWLYLVQYLSGAEGWNCIETNAIIFYSQNYSYRIMTQAAGRIDRINTPFKNLYYYTLRSSAPIDLAIAEAIYNKKYFNEQNFYSQQ